MFYLLGSPRSGTTILAQCLSSHSKIIIPDETDLIIPLTFITNRIKDETRGKRLIAELVSNTERFPYSLGEYLTNEEIERAIDCAHYNANAIICSIYDQLAKSANKEIAGDKSPNDLLVIRELFGYGAITAESKVVHIVRDIRDVMTSLARTDWAPPDLSDYFPRMWATNNLFLNKKMQNRPNYALVRYEDFAENPEKELRRICVTLEVEFEQTMLSGELRHRRYQGVAHHSNIYNPISKNSIDSYKKHLTHRQIKEYEKQSIDGLIAFGYKSDSWISKFFLKN